VISPFHILHDRKKPRDIPARKRGLPRRGCPSDGGFPAAPHDIPAQHVSLFALPVARK